MIINSENIKKSIKRFKTEFIYSSGSQIILMLMLIFQNKILATNLDKESYGEFSLILSLYVLISMLPFTAFDQALSRMSYNEIGKNGKIKYSNNVISVYLVLFFLYGLLAFFLNLIVSEFILKKKIFLFFLYLISEVLKNTFFIIENAQRNRKKVFYVRLLDFLLRTIGLLVVFNLKKIGINPILLILGLSNLVSMLLLYGKVPKIWKELDVKYIRYIYIEVLKFSLPLMIWAIFGWIQNMANRWFLKLNLDSDAVAMYTILISLSFFVPNAFYGIINNFFMPYIFSRQEKTSYKLFKNYLLIAFTCLLLYFIFTIFFSDILVLILADSKYLEISKWIPWITLSSIIYIVAMLSTFEIYRCGNTKLLLLPTILPGILTGILGFFTVRYYGLKGAIFNYVLGQIVYSTIVLKISFKFVKGAENTSEKITVEEQTDLEIK